MVSDYARGYFSRVFITGSTNSDTQCVDLLIVDDSALEGDQAFTLILATLDPDVILRETTTTITITDNDGKY